MQEGVTINRSPENPHMVQVRMVISVGKLDAMIAALNARNTPVAQDLLGMVERAGDSIRLKEYVIPVTWHMEGEFKVQAHSLEEAVYKVNAGDPPWDGLPDGQYIDDSLQVNADCARELNGEETNV